MSIILGIDPGSRNTGFGVIHVKNGLLEHVSHGVIQLNPKDGFPARMRDLGQSLKKIFSKYQPNIVVIEKIFLGKNADSAFKLGHARGVAMYEAAVAGAEVLEYATRLVKKGITGKGSAQKEDVQVMLQRFLKIQKIKSLDASDALALAVYQATKASTRGR